MFTPEQPTRQNIDALLQRCGWIVQSRAKMNLGAGLGVAVREFPLETVCAGYLLFVDRRVIGAIEAKAAGATLTGIETQAKKYRVGLPAAQVSTREALESLPQKCADDDYRVKCDAVK